MSGKNIILGGLAAAVVLIGLLYWISRPDSGASGNEDGLILYCAAGVKTPVFELARRYEKEYGVRIQLQYGGSGTLLSNIEVSGKGDLYVAADQSYVDIAAEKGLVDEIIPLAWQRPVIVVAEGNPKNIDELDDLLQPGLRIALGNPDAASIGKQTKILLEKAGLWEQIKAKVEERGVFKPTVPEVANDVKLGAADVGIIWDSTAAQYPDLETIRVPLFDDAANQVNVAVLNSTTQPTAALRFARYLNSVIGNEEFEKQGFEPVEGDAWEEHPELTFFCGSVNRRAIEDVIHEFEEREGVTVNTVYNGCGILTGQMNIIHQEQGGAGFPDVYMACDRYYLETVKDWFQEDVDVSDAEIVIVVPKDNPKNIQTAEDLLQPGIRVTVGQPQQCTIGALTQIMLEEMGIYQELKESRNIVAEEPSSANLVPTVIIGSADATIAYVTDTLAESDKVDYVRIDSDAAIAIQPFSIAKSSEHKYLGRRLYNDIAAARDRFEAAGFHFRLVEEE